LTETPWFWPEIRNNYGKIVMVGISAYQSMKRIGLLKVCFLLGFIGCEVPSIADTTLGISEHYLFFCHQTGMVDHWILRLHTFYKSTHVEFKTLSTVETLTRKHQSINQSINIERTVLFILVNLMISDELKELTKVVRCWAWAV
jgi:hypothetical protein